MAFQPLVPIRRIRPGWVRANHRAIKLEKRRMQQQLTCGMPRRPALRLAPLPVSRLGARSYVPRIIDPSGVPKGEPSLLHRKQKDQRCREAQKDETRYNHADAPARVRAPPPVAN